MEQARLVYPMSKISEMLSEDEIKKMSERYSFDREDEYFHFDKDGNFLESLSEEDINYYNEDMPKNQQLVIAA